MNLLYNEVFSLQKILRELVSIPGPCGFEHEIARYLYNRLKDKADEIWVDGLGNVIAKKNGAHPGPTLMLSAHADEVGFIVKKIESNGLIRFENGVSLNFDVSWAINGKPESHNAWIYGDKAGCSVHPAILYGETGGYQSDTAVQAGKYAAFDMEIRHFLDCIKGEAEPLSPIEDGIAIQRILNGIYESAEQGKEVIL